MKKAAQFSIVLVTAPNKRVARQLAVSALKGRRAACANLISAVESHYWWRGKIERSAEVLIIFKTTRRRLAALEELILREHPYDTPEFLALPLQAGTARYLKWMAASTESRPAVGHKLHSAIRSEFRLQAVPPAKAGTPNSDPQSSHGSTESRPAPARRHRRITLT